MNEYIIFIVLICLVNIRTSFNLSNPLFFFLASWVISLLICLLNIFSFYPSLSDETLIFIFSFLFLTSVSYYVGHSLPIRYKEAQYNILKLIQCYNLIFFIVIVTFCLTVIKLGLPPLLSSGGVRSEYYLSGGGELCYLMIYPCFFLGLYILYHFHKGGSYGFIIIQELILFLVILVRGNKMAIFSILLMICFFWGQKVKFINLIGLLFLVVFIFSFVSIIYKRNVEDLDTLKQAKIALTGFDLPDNLYFLYDPLIYLASNIYNINGLLCGHLSSIGMGTFSFKGICQLIAPFNPHLNVMMGNSLIIANTSLTVATLSTYSGLGLLYFDFGPIIAVLIFMLIGFTSGILSIPNKKFKLNITGSFLAFILFQTLALSFFTLYLGNLEVISNLLLMFIVDIYAREPLYAELESF